MQLKPDVDLARLLSAVQHCRKDVIFHTSAGDNFNLKSTLSQFVLAAALDQIRTMENTVEFSEEDAALLLPFLE